MRLDFSKESVAALTAEYHANRPRPLPDKSANDKLPRDWERMSVTGLWNWLNDPRRFSTPESTVDAIVFAVKQRGTAALKEPATAERLSLCDQAAKQEVDRRVAELIEART